MADISYGRLPFNEQIAFFRRKLNMPTESWLDVWQAAHDHAFMVAGANRDDLVADFRAAIDKVIADGGTLRDFRKDFDTIVAKHGWDYNGGRNWRSRVIYETNLRTSYAAGRYAQLQAVKKSRPYWQYVHSDAVQNPRPMHLAWNGMVLHADDPWWQAHYPPNGWGCQCTIHALNQRDLERLGKSGPDKAPGTDLQPVTVGQRSPGGPRVVETPAGVDPGFGYAPGADAYERLVQTRLQKTTQFPAEAASTSSQAALTPAAFRSLVDGYKAFQAQVLAERKIRNQAYIIGTLEPDLVKTLAVHDVEPATAAIVARDAEIIHALRSAKPSLTPGGRALALTAEELAQLPNLLRKRKAVLLDPASESLLFVYEAARREAGKIVVAVDYRLKTTEGKIKVNAFRTASHIDLADVRAEIKNGKLVLLEGSL